MGTGDDFKMAWTTSAVGSVRFLRGVAFKVDEFDGDEKNLDKQLSL